MVFPHFKRMHSESASFAFFHVNMQNSFSLFMQLKLSFEVDSWCLGSSGLLVVWLGYRLNFQKLFVRTNTNLIFVFVLKP
jgi:hypothetical protein